MRVGFSGDPSTGAEVDTDRGSQSRDVDSVMRLAIIYARSGDVNRRKEGGGKTITLEGRWYHR